MSETQASDYSARHLSVLEGLEAVRKRPGMYIGSTDHRGLMHCLWEIIDNAVDEALEGFCDTIDVRLHPDHSASVADNGRGIPVDEVPGVGLSGVEVVFTKLHAGGKFGSGSYAASGGLHGVGASVVNALSARMDVEVDRCGKTWQMCFRRGEPGEFDDSRQRTPNSPFTPFTDESRLKTVGKVAKKKTGTRVRFWADFQIFPSDEGFTWETLLARARQTAFLVPGLTINCFDERGEEVVHESFRFDGGVVLSLTLGISRVKEHSLRLFKRWILKAAIFALLKPSVSAKLIAPFAGGSATTRSWNPSLISSLPRRGERMLRALNRPF